MKTIESPGGNPCENAPDEAIFVVQNAGKKNDATLISGKSLAEIRAEMRENSPLPGEVLDENLFLKLLKGINDNAVSLEHRDPSASFIESVPPFRQAELLLDDQRCKEALAALDHAPENSWTNGLRGIARCGIGDQGGLDDLNKAIDTSEEPQAQSRLLAERARFRKEFLEGEGSLEDMDRAVSLEGNNTSFLTGRAGARLLFSNDAKGAYEDLSTALSADPQLIALYFEATETASLPSEAQSWGISLFEGCSDAELNESLSNDTSPFAAAWRATLLRRQCRYSEALREFDACKNDLGNPSWMRTLRGETRLQAGDRDGLAEMAETASSKDAQAWQHAWYGRARLAFGRDSGAVDSLDTAVALAPNFGWYRAWRGEVKRLLKRTEGVFEDFNLSLLIARLERLRGEVSFDYAGLASAWRGNAAATAGLHEQAIHSFDLSLSLMPDYGLARQGRSRSMRALGHYSEWFDDLIRAAELDPKYMRSLDSRPEKELREMRDDVDRHRQDTKRGNDARLWSGVLSGLLGDWEKAESELALLKGTDAIAWHGRALWELGKLEEANTVLTEALNTKGLKSGTVAMASAYSARVLAQCGNLPAAAAAMDKAVENDGRQLAYLVDRARVNIASGNAKAAHDDLSKVVSMENSDAFVFADLHLVEALLGNKQKSAEARLRADALDPEKTKQHLEHWSHGDTVPWTGGKAK